MILVITDEIFINTSTGIKRHMYIQNLQNSLSFFTNINY